MRDTNPYQATTVKLDGASTANAATLGFLIGIAFATPILLLGAGSSISFLRQREWEMAMHGFFLVIPACVVILCGYWWATSGNAHTGWSKLVAALFQGFLISGIFLGSVAYLGAGVSGFRRVHLGTEDVVPAVVLFVLVSGYCWLLGTVSHWAIRRNSVPVGR